MPNEPIAHALADVSDNGWHKDDVWQMDAASSYGDEAVGTAYEARYWKPTEDGLYMVIDESYYVEATKTYNQPEVIDTFVIAAQYRFTICTDPEQPGDTEEWSDIEYDQEVDVMFHESLTEAEAIARDWALADLRFTFMWDDKIPTNR